MTVITYRSHELVVQKVHPWFAVGCTCGWWYTGESGARIELPHENGPTIRRIWRSHLPGNLL